MPDLTVDQILKLPTNQKILILCGVVAAIIGAYIYFSYLPNTETLKGKREELTKLQAQHNQQLKVLANLPKFKLEVKELQTKFAETLKLLPESREIPSLLSNISTLAQDAGLQILLFEPKKEMVKGFYADIPVKMQVRGKYHNLGYFFDRVSKLSRIVNISDIEIKSKKGRKKGEDLSDVDAKFQAVTFKFVEKEQARAKKGKKKRRRK